MQLQSSSTSRRWISLPAVAVLLVTAATVLFWSPVRMLDNDEYLVRWTDSVATLHQLLQVQLHTPISLDPIFYHALVHFCLKAFGDHAEIFALRLPSLLGFLLMQVCLYRFVRRFSSETAAVFAMAFPAATATLFYAVQARPYALLLGLFALVMLNWQNAIRAEENRRGTLLILAAGIAIAFNTHYFAILLLAPLCGAELYRSIAHRRVDVPVVVAIIVGMAGIVFTLPFARAAAVFHQHYYTSGSATGHAITQAYRAFFVDYTNFSMTLQRMLAMLFVLFAVLLVLGYVRQIRKRSVEILNEEIVFLVVLAALPFLGYLMAHVLHSYEVRYMLGAMVGIAPILAITLTPIFRNKTAARLLPLLLCIAIATIAAARIQWESKVTQQQMASLFFSPTQKAALLATPTQTLYIQNFGSYSEAAYYEPDPEIRSRLALLYSSDEELRWRMRDTNSLTALHMQSFTSEKTAAWQQIQAQPGEHLLLLYHSGWDWTDQALAASHVRVTPLGSAVQGDLVAVNFKP